MRYPECWAWGPATGESICTRSVSGGNDGRPSRQACWPCMRWPGTGCCPWWCATSFPNGARPNWHGRCRSAKSASTPSRCGSRPPTCGWPRPTARRCSPSAAWRWKCSGGPSCRRAWSFADIRVTAPSATLVIAPDGRFNIAALLETLARRPREPSTDTRLPRVIVEQFALEQGKVEMHDRRAGYENAFTPIDFALSNFSTLPEQDESHTFTAQSARGGKLRWKGTASVNPIHASGEVAIENASLPELAVYLKSYTRASVAAGQLSVTLPYRLSYADGKFEASLVGAKASLRDLALAREGATDSFAALTRLDVSGVDADLVRRQATVGEVRADGGELSVRRDASGELDLANLMIAAAGPAAAKGPVASVAPRDWKVDVRQVLLDQLNVRAMDETVSPPLKVAAGKVRLQLQAAAGQAGDRFQLKLSQASLSLADLARDQRRAGPAEARAARASRTAPWTSPSARPRSAASMPKVANCRWCASATARSTCWRCCPGPGKSGGAGGARRQALGRGGEDGGAEQVRRRSRRPGRGREGPRHRPGREARRRRQRPEAEGAVQRRPEAARRRAARGAGHAGARQRRGGCRRARRAARARALAAPAGPAPEAEDRGRQCLGARAAHHRRGHGPQREPALRGRAECRRAHAQRAGRRPVRLLEERGRRQVHRQPSAPIGSTSPSFASWSPMPS